jgi:transposase-like protein
MCGRYPAGAELVEYLDGSVRAKERLRVILETMMGPGRVQEACARLGICEQRYRQLRQALLQAALDSLEDRPAGRPRRAAEPAEVAALRQQLAELQRALQVAQVREEIALALPQVSQPTPDPAGAAGSAREKKRRPPRSRRAPARRHRR